MKYVATYHNIHMEPVHKVIHAETRSEAYSVAYRYGSKHLLLLNVHPHPDHDRTRVMNVDVDQVMKSIENWELVE